MHNMQQVTVQALSIQQVSTVSRLSRVHIALQAQRKESQTKGTM